MRPLTTKKRRAEEEGRLSRDSVRTTAAGSALLRRPGAPGRASRPSPRGAKRIGLHPLVGVVDRVRRKVKWLAGRRLPKMMGSGAVAQAPSSGRAPFLLSSSYHRPVGLLRLDHDAAFPLELPRATTWRHGQSSCLLHPYDAEMVVVGILPEASTVATFQL